MSIILKAHSVSGKYAAVTVEIDRAKFDLGLHGGSQLHELARELLNAFDDVADQLRLIDEGLYGDVLRLVHELYPVQEEDQS